MAGSSAAGVPRNFAPGTLITLGVTHVVPKDMELQLLARQFAMLPEAIRHLNPDLPMDDEWVGVGRQVCIIPAICDSSVATPLSSVALDGSGRQLATHS
jgi:hypothetical protein